MNERDTENSLLLDLTQSEEIEEEKEGKCSKYCNPLVSIIIFLVALLIVVLALVVFWKMEVPEKTRTQVVGFNQSQISGSIKTREECTTAECITLSSTLLNWQNPKIDPCDDFYEHSCGKYHEHTMNDGTRVNEKDRIVIKLIQHFLLSNQSANTASEIAMKIMYRSCERSLQPRNIITYREAIQKEVFLNIKKIGNWPMANMTWNESEFSLNDMIANMAKLHMLHYGFFEAGILDYPIDAAPKQLMIRPARSRFDMFLPEFTHVISELLRLSNVTFLNETLTKDIQDGLNLDTELGKFRIPDREPESVTVKELKKAVPAIDFERILKTLLNPERGNWTNVKNRTTAARFESFFNPEKNISSIISKTKPRVMANYLIMKYIEHAYIYYSMRFRYASKYSHCLELTINLLPRAALRVFVRNHYKKENMVVASKMVEIIKDAFIEMFENSTWLHEETRKAAILKVKKMNKVIGYTEEYEREGALDQQFETLHLTPEDSFFTIMTKVHRFKTEQLMEYVSTNSLLNPIDSLVVTNAFYFPGKNLLSLLAPFLDKPHFDAHYPRYVTMAGVGRVIAHEIGHGFDTEGRHSDETGQYRDWWTPEDSAEYDKRASCFQKQFDEFKDPFLGEMQQGLGVLSEVIADALGMEATWIAFKKLDLSNEQTLIKFGDQDQDFKKLFFRAAALARSI
ncbi:hypothetical protein GCK72_006908 [Caenorhabditis remanei]|uniref:Peptidase M13 N-terminal domain-containing protein n=1 Tax=Caenorhabditis remanei TaxID=31234 RepID=A0A6A5HG52_CAERE|nr:hypothetical protein GCK72_006908 [Caenorhabditis remanei]KAF1766950.1 hypothetical protein GCK72_006908 [Caenorhabditis remanei]